MQQKKFSQELIMAQGHFDSGKLNGFCNFTSSLDGSYFGYFSDGVQKNGVGKFIEKNGSVYIGNFEKAQYNGMGIRTLSDGSV